MAQRHAQPLVPRRSRTLTAVLATVTLAGCGGAMPQKDAAPPSVEKSEPVAPTDADKKLDASDSDGAEDFSFDDGGTSGGDDGGDSADGQSVEEERIDIEGDGGAAVEVEGPVEDAARAMPEPAPMADGASTGEGGGPSWAAKRAERSLSEARSTLRTLLEPHGGSLASSSPLAITCDQTCELAAAVCESSEAICDVAAQLPEASGDCRWAAGECRAAETRCRECGGRP